MSSQQLEARIDKLERTFDPETVAELVIEAVEAYAAPLLERLAANEALVKHITGERTAMLRDAGDWETGAAYGVDDLVHYGDGLWLCTKAHTATGPAVDRDKWRRIKRIGKDAD